MSEEEIEKLAIEWSKNQVVGTVRWIDIFKAGFDAALKVKKRKNHV